jgi:hypothetical protein
MSSRFINGDLVLAGNTSGTAVPAGRVGEVVTATITVTTATTSDADVTGASLSLTAGIWLVIYNVSAVFQTGATSGNGGRVEVKLTDNSNNIVNNSIRSLYAITRAAALNRIEGVLSDTQVLNLSSSATYKLRCKREDDAGTNSGFILQDTNNHTSTFMAVRIA